MAEYIDREELLKHYIALVKIDWNNKVSPPSWSYAYESFIDYLAELPTADVVEVVRCCDCKHCEMVLDIIGNPSLFCTRMVGSIPVDFTDFCSYGKRKGASE